MYAVIFKAQLLNLDTSYEGLALKLRDLAINDYNCLDFFASTSNNVEIAISYWRCKDDIKKWKLNKLHQQAQVLGKTKFYESYSIKIIKI